MPDVKNRDSRIGESYTSGRGSYKPRELADGETSPYVNSGIDQAEQFANDPNNRKDTDASVRAREEAPAWKTDVNAKKQGEKSSSPSKGESGIITVTIKKKGPMATVITALVVGLIAGGGFLTTALGPIAFVENIVDDLNDQLAAMDIAGTKVLRGKLPSNERKEALRGCTKLSIRCKFSTLSNRQITKLRVSGIEVSIDSSYRNLTGMKRNIATSYRFQGVDYDPAQWAEQLRTNRAAINAQRRANNMKYLGVSDNTFSSRVLNRFGISKKPPELKGNPQDRVNALLNRAGTGSVAEISFRPVDRNGNTVSEDSPNKVGYLQEGAQPRTNADGSPRPYTDRETAGMRTAVERIQRPPSKVTKASIGAFSALGYWDMACSIRNLLGGAAIAAKAAGQAELIAYSMGIMSKVHEMKAGDISAEDAEAVGEFFMGTDSRSEIPNVASVLADNTNEVTVTDAALGMEKNPNHRKNALDSGLYQMSSLGGVAAPNPTFSLGMGQNTLLSGISNAAEIATIITSLGSGGAVCNFVQHGAVRLVGIVGLVAAGGISGGGALAFQAFIAAGMMAAMWIIEGAINNALGGSIIESADLVDDTVGRGAAVWSGAAGMMSTSAQARGLMPGTADEIVNYRRLTNKTHQEYIAMEQETANPFDIYNQYSFVGMLSRSLMRYTPKSSDVTSVIGSVSSIVRGGLRAPTTHAVEMSPDRFKKCDDEAYQNLNKNFGASDVHIDADVQCNIRYVMPATDLALEPEDVIDWMETNRCGGKYSTCVEPDTATGFPRGYTPQEPKAAQDGVVGFISGVAEGFIGQFYNSRIDGIDDYNDYAKFLDFCAYRVLPYGETFEDGQAINDTVGNDWKTGAKCLEKSTQMSYFRMYTLYLSVMDAVDDEPPEEEGAIDGGGSGTGSAPDIPDGDWMWPLPPNPNESKPGPCFGGPRVHAGLDINSNKESDVYAMQSGVVISVGSGGAAGNDIMIKGDSGVWYAYQHLVSRPTALLGQRVEKGQVVGQAGQSGNVKLGSSKAHLHVTMSSVRPTTGSYGNISEVFDPMTVLESVRPSHYQCVGSRSRL